MTSPALYESGTGPPQEAGAIEVFTFPSSLAQQRFWFLDQLEPGNPAYNIAVRWRLSGPVDPVTLERAFNEILRRHEVLRTCFLDENDLPLQAVFPSLAIRVPLIDLRLLREPDRDAEAERITLEVARQPFDLKKLPLIRACLLRVADHEHIVLMTVHHIVADGWSIGIVAREMCRLYEKFSQGDVTPLPDLPIQYGDFAVWQREWVKSGAIGNHAGYWKEHLRGCVPFEMPPDRPRAPAGNSARNPDGSILSILLPKSLTDALHAYSARRNCTFFATAVSAFMTLLFRYSGQADISVTTQIAGRNRLELEDLAGLFINTIVLRADLSGDPLFPDLLDQMKRTVTQALAHQEMPFEQLVEMIRPKRDLNRKALFQVNFIYQRAFVENTKFAGVEFVDLPSRSPGALYDLNVFMVERVDGWRLSCEYNTELYEAATITGLLGHFRSLLEGIAENPDRRISGFALLSPEERRRLLAEWNRTDADYPRSACVHQLFEAQAERTPNAAAVVFGNERLTYRQLNSRANQVAHRLQALGVAPGVLVAVCVERSLEMMVALLGVLKAGAAYVPLDPAYPPERLAYMLEDANVRVMISQSRLARIVPEYAGATLYIDGEGADLARRDSSNPAPAAAAEDLAYVIYTSGSTGKPKGVQIPHRAVVNLLCSMRRRPGLTASDKLLAVTTLSFDIAGLELFLPLTVGAQVVIASRETSWDGTQLLKLLDDSGATVLQATPATWRLLIEAGWKRSPSLKMLCGGEALPMELAAQLLERGGELWNMYGPTETTIWSSVNRLDLDRPRVLLGPPIANTRFYVLDNALEPVPAGVPGELYIAGDGLARGYLHLDDLTRERFVRNPFDEHRDARMYRTGDIVRLRPGGNLEFMGRGDHQVKIRGFRIELEEIQSALLRHPGIQQAVVIAREIQADGPRLEAYVVPVAGAQPVPQAQLKTELRGRLREKLPDYMQPSILCVLDALPLTANGKIDRAALYCPDAAESEPDQSSVEPRDALELRLREIWEDVLDVRPIGVTDNYFDLGGHSILAVRLFARINKEFGKHLPLSVLFQAPNIEKLAGLLRGNGPEAAWSSLVPIQTEGANPPLFIISGLGGNVVRFRDLARYLGPDQPVYALQPAGLDGKRPFLTSIEEMAAHYIGEIRPVRSQGPYHLAGYSFGGLVTFEMARQLSAQGDEVGLLALLDAPEWSYLRESMKARGFADNLRVLKSRLTAILFGPGRLEYIRDRIRRRSSQLFYHLYRAMGRPIPQTYGTITDVNWFAARKYVPQPYPGRVTLLRTSPERRRAGQDPMLGWGKLAAEGVMVHEVAGSHEDMTTEPNVRILAATLSSCMESAEPVPAPR